MERCGNCEACRQVEVSKSLLMPRSYGPRPEHANDATVEAWNKTLANNPCKKVLEKRIDDAISLCKEQRDDMDDNYAEIWKEIEDLLGDLRITMKNII